MVKRPLSEGLGEMVARCKEDVLVTRKLYEQMILKGMDDKIPEQVWNIESSVARIVAEQHERGITFNVTAAKELHVKLTERMQSLADEVADGAGPQAIPENKLDNPPKIQFKKDGTVSVNMLKYCAKHGWEVFGREATKGNESIQLPIAHSLETTRRLDIGSSDEVKEYLLSLGWKPTIWNHKVDPETRKKTKTSPKLHGDDGAMCTGLDSIQEPQIR